MDPAVGNLAETLSKVWSLLQSELEDRRDSENRSAGILRLLWARNGDLSMLSSFPSFMYLFFGTSPELVVSCLILLIHDRIVT